MSKFFNGKVKVDDQVTEFDMSQLAEGKLTLPTGAVKNISEISDSVKVGTGNSPISEGDKLVQEKHLKDVESAADAAITSVSGALDSEIARATAAEGVLQTNIDAEVARATGEESRIEGKHDAYVISNDAALAAEEASRISGDNTLQTNINSLSGAVASDFASMEAAYQAADSAEQAARIAADTTLQGNIDAEKARIDAMLSGSTVDFDTLKEIVDAYQLADTDIVSSIVSLSGALDQEIVDRIADVDAEEARALAAEALLQTNINNEETARIAADSVATTDRAAIRSEFAAADSAEATARANADATLQANIDAEAAARLAKDNDLQAELDATQAGAGLAIDGAYAAPASNYISAATSLMDADKKLDAQIKVNADGLATEITNRTNADTTLQGNIDAEAAARIAADTTLQGNIDALSGAVSSDLSSLETDLLAEVARVESESDAAEATLTANLNAEITNRTNADSAIQAELDASQAGAGLEPNGSYVFPNPSNYMSGAISLKDADIKLDAQIKVNADGLAAEIADRIADVDAEEVRALAAEAVLSGNLAQEIADRTAAVSAEEAARIAADAGLQTQIDFITSNTDPAALDSLTEIVNAFQTADSDLAVALNAYTASHNAEFTAFSGAVASDFSSMEAAYQAADSAIQAELDASQVGAGLEANGSYVFPNPSNYMSGAVSLKDADIKLDAQIKVNADAILDEEARALAAEAVLSAEISAEETARIAADTTLQGNIDALSGAVASDLSSLETDLTAEIARVESESDAAEAALTTSLNNEIARATGEEARIEGKFDAHFDGFVKVAYLTEVDAVMGLATHYVVNASAPKVFTIPTMTEDYFIMIKVAEGSNSVTFDAGVGESIDGEVDGSIVLHGGASVMLVKKGGVMYLF